MNIITYLNGIEKHRVGAGIVRQWVLWDTSELLTNIMLITFIWLNKDDSCPWQKYCCYKSIITANNNLSSTQLMHSRVK